MPGQEALTVTELNIYIKQLMERDMILSAVWVKGEISNFKLHSSGHMYMALKDETGVIKAVMFKSSAVRLKFMPENGMRVIAAGRVSVYERDGQYQVYLSHMQPDGAGELHVAYEQLKKKLEVEGLFLDQHKKKPPAFPKKIAVVTSPTGAALRDMLHVLKRRYSLADVLICPVLVQGEEASQQIARAIEYVNENKLADVIITGRGGGSIEDLWAFNEEILARAIYHSEIPVISAVGHETDFTIADFVADLRAPTPSAAAEIAVPSFIQLSDRLTAAKSRLLYLQRVFINEKRNKLSSVLERISRGKLLDRVDQNRLLLDSVTKRLESGGKLIIGQNKENFYTLASKLDVLSPLSVLLRGYSIVLKENKTIKSIHNLKKDDVICVKMVDGSTIAKVCDVKEGN